MKKHYFCNLLPLPLLCCLVVLPGCSSKHPVNFKVHTEPEGAHVIYRQDNASWIYLGLTPLDVVEVMSGEALESDHTVSLRTMRCGYLDQTKEWSGDELQRDLDEKGNILWTPRLIKNSQ